ncbi:uncharacterized protein L3040_007711 [Drepanopeziza brunnea f. sp. 'multigermtubi']|nr:hypothetical protein L3040_007711 [Drepanopeziza brunnea f. sp. 'multigermtubi']
MENDDFADVEWLNNRDHGGRRVVTSPEAESEDQGSIGRHSGAGPLGRNADAMDLAGVGDGILECLVTQPIKENDGSKDAFVSYLVTTNTTFPSFQKPTTSVRRRFTDFVFLYKTLSREYPACAVPPLPDKHKMEYVRGDRFGPDFTQRRANSLHRFLTRLALHPVLRRSALLIIFLESTDWNATMRSRPHRGGSASEQNSGVFDNFTDTFINAFTKVHKPDKRFIEVREKSDKLDEDLGHVEKIVARVARRENDLEADLKELAEQFQKLVLLEPGVEESINLFAHTVEDTSSGMRRLKEHTDQDYLGSLRDMQAYSSAVKNLLKAREQKQLDFEQLTEYLAKNTTDRDMLVANGPSGSTGAGSFIQRKIEDVRGVDPSLSHRERLRKIELRIDDLTREVEEAKKTTEAFDEEVVREVQDFERIKRIEFKAQFGALADAHVEFYGEGIAHWERYVREMESLGAPIA